MFIWEISLILGYWVAIWSMRQYIISCFFNSKFNGVKNGSTRLLHWSIESSRKFLYFRLFGFRNIIFKYFSFDQSICLDDELISTIIIERRLSKLIKSSFWWYNIFISNAKRSGSFSCRTFRWKCWKKNQICIWGAFKRLKLVVWNLLKISIGENPVFLCQVSAF